MKKKTKKAPFRRMFKPVTVCRFCQTETVPDYKKWEVLTHYISDRGKILQRERTGACTQHQRHMTVAVKRARYLALLPYIVRPL